MATDFLPNWVHNALPTTKETAIIANSWMGHLKWMQYTLRSYKKTGAFLVLALDTHLRPDEPMKEDYSSYLPPPDVLGIADAVVLKHPTWDADKRNGWLWNFVYGAAVVLAFSNIRHVLSINTDCALDRPEGMGELIELLGGGDFMPQSVDTEPGGTVRTMHTCGILMSRAGLESLAGYFLSKLRDNRPESYSPEILLSGACNQLQLRMVPPPQSPRFPAWHDFAGAVDHYQSYNEDSTWKQVVGFRNLCAECDTAGIERMRPLPAKYFDLRNGGEMLPGYERNSLYLYYTTGDLRYLWKYWDQVEDSWYDRRSYPIHHYGSDTELVSEEG